MSQARLSATTAGRHAIYQLIPKIPKGKFTCKQLGTNAPSGCLVSLHDGGYIRKVGRIKDGRQVRWQWEATDKFWRKFGDKA